MLAEMTAREFIEWQAYYKHDPWGDQRDDMRAAMVASVMATLWGKRQHNLREFMLFPEQGAYRQTIEEQRAIMRGFASALSGNHHR